ncbi:glycosyltransferase [Alicyclobacillus sp. TC]|uniref:glycosyltransferase family 2 protein n=1 Tax=Alicyclobacillus sp. TC TaxID=2606450 RepID=UPI001932D73E|nr:glycosyltransferase family 2 protein [Alicyclobacillus sp. TC]QRF23944.1 glycosyltransferase [Alicyclobacillus sp. TC]
MDIWRFFVQTMGLGIQIFASLLGIYQTLLSFPGYFPAKKPHTHSPEKKFAILIPAHNEERVIGFLLDSLFAQDYPSHLYDIHVIADHCSDHTAEVALAHGAKVHCREQSTQRSKGYAIEWMLKRLQEMSVSYDAVLIFDADNLVEADFLQAMNHHLCTGHRVIQGYLGVKNPFDSWVTVSQAVSYWFSNCMWQKARNNLGLACSLGGTGVCVDFNLLAEMGWHATGLAEDLEFGVRCIRRGIYPVWAHEARVYDEKPIDLVSSLRQRIRWMRGHFYCAKRNFFPLLSKALQKRDVRQLDAALYLFQPIRFIILFLISLMVFFHISISSDMGINHLSGLLPTYFWILISAILYLQIPFALFLEKVNWRAYFALPLLPIFLWTWGPITLYAFLSCSDQRWSHTEHKRSIRMDEL